MVTREDRHGVTHGKHVRRQLGHAAGPAPIRQAMRNGVTESKPRQLREDRRILRPADIRPDGIFGEIFRPLYSMRIGQGDSQHVFQPVGSGILRRDQHTVKRAVAQHREIGPGLVEQFGPVGRWESRRCHATGLGPDHDRRNSGLQARFVAIDLQQRQLVTGRQAFGFGHRHQHRIQVDDFLWTEHGR